MKSWKEKAQAWQFREERSLTLSPIDPDFFGVRGEDRRPARRELRDIVLFDIFIYMI